MEQEIKKPLDIIQELIAIHTTRMDAGKRLLQENGVNITNESKKYIAQLMTELSNYGDAVPSTAERENDYQETWNSILPKLDVLSKEQSTSIFKQLEENLEDMYKDILAINTELPGSLKEIITQQHTALTAVFNHS